MAVLIVLGVSGKWWQAWQKREEKMLGSKILQVKTKNSYCLTLKSHWWTSSLVWAAAKLCGSAVFACVSNITSVPCKIVSLGLLSNQIASATCLWILLRPHRQSHKCLNCQPLLFRFLPQATDASWLCSFAWEGQIGSLCWCLRTSIAFAIARNSCWVSPRMIQVTFPLCHNHPKAQPGRANRTAAKVMNIKSPGAVLW